MFFWQKPLPPPKTKPLYGVNLGGWLLLEKWMTPSLFASMDAVDEYSLLQLGASRPEIFERLQQHRDTFITSADFAWLQLHGIEAVRLPVGYWVFGDAEPYKAAIDYVDKAFRWAEQTGLKIILDLHGAPGSQNGLQESGRIGSVAWHKDKRNIVESLEVIKKLAERYKDSPALLGIELLNEPNGKIPRRVLLKYYEAAYKIIRDICGNTPWVVFSDNFKPRRWRFKLRAPSFRGCFIDTHQYQTYTRRDQKLNIAGHLEKTLGPVARSLAKMHKFHPVVVGEWSLALNDRSLLNLSRAQREAAYRAYAAAQLIAFEQVDAWFFWSYKIETGGAWSFRAAIENGRLPNFSAIKKS